MIGEGRQTWTNRALLEWAKSREMMCRMQRCPRRTPRKLNSHIFSPAPTRIRIHHRSQDAWEIQFRAAIEVQESFEAAAGTTGTLLTNVREKRITK